MVGGRGGGGGVKNISSNPNLNGKEKKTSQTFRHKQPWTVCRNGKEPKMGHLPADLGYKWTKNLPPRAITDVRRSRSSTMNKNISL